MSHGVDRYGAAGGRSGPENRAADGAVVGSRTLEGGVGASGQDQTPVGRPDGQTEKTEADPTGVGSILGALTKTG